MSDNFKALVVNQEGENFTREVKSIDKSFLKHGDVLVKVDYSDLNYKDALILNNGAKLVKEFPHIPGIDFSGTVLESDSSKFAKGDRYSNIDFLVNSKYQSDPTRNWCEKIDKELYKIRVSNRKKEKIQFNSKVIGELFNPVSSVRHYSESREEINDMESASFLTGMTESIAKYRQLYVLQIVRYWVEMIRSLQYTAMKLGHQDIPWFTDVFAIFNNKDSYFLTRKTYEKN